MLEVNKIDDTVNVKQVCQSITGFFLKEKFSNPDTWRECLSDNHLTITFVLLLCKAMN